MTRLYFLCKEKAKSIGLGGMSVVIAYYFLLSLFPLLITATTVLPYFNIQPSVLTPYLESLVPRAILEPLNPWLINLLTTQKGGLLSLGLIGTVWSAGRSVHYIREGIAKAYGLERGHFLLARVSSSALLILLIILLGVLLAVFSLGDMLISYVVMHFGGAMTTLSYFRYLKWPVIFVALYLVILFLYIISLWHEATLKSLLPGAFVATLSILAATCVFSLYFSVFSGSFSAYGAIGAVFMLMIWLRALAALLLAGAIFNSVKRRESV